MKSESGNVLQGAVATVLVVFVALMVLLYMFGTVVPPGTMGVRQIKVGPGQGFSDTALPPGYHWSVPFYSTVHVMPKNLQILHFSRGGQGAELHEINFAPLEVQSSDRATVDVDLSIIYSFYNKPGIDGGMKHGGPADLFKLGTMRESWMNEVRRRAEDQLKRHLGQLQTASFYNAKDREERREMAERNINAALAPAGIKVHAVLLRRFTYREDRIDNAIFQKNLQEQEERKNLAQSSFVEAEGLVKKIEAEKNAEIETIKVATDSQARVTRSEGDLYEARQKAKGDLLLAEAQAKVDRLRATALAESAGAKAYLARELAPLLRSLKGGVVTDVDPYNLSDWSRKLSGEGQGR